MSDDTPITNSTGATGTAAGVTGGTATATSGAGTQATQATQATQTSSTDPKILTDFGLTAQQITDMEVQYSIPQSVKDKFPDLVALLIKTESMNTEEREYWFQVMPVMSDDQIVKLRDILVNERNQLKKIDEEYNQEMSKLGENHKKEWNSFEAQAKKKVAVELERKHE